MGYDIRAHVTMWYETPANEMRKDEARKFTVEVKRAVKLQKAIDAAIKLSSENPNVVFDIYNNDSFYRGVKGRYLNGERNDGSITLQVRKYPVRALRLKTGEWVTPEYAFMSNRFGVGTLGGSAGYAPYMYEGTLEDDEKVYHYGGKFIDTTRAAELIESSERVVEYQKTYIVPADYDNIGHTTNLSLTTFQAPTLDGVIYHLSTVRTMYIRAGMYAQEPYATQLTQAADKLTEAITILQGNNLDK